MLHPLVALAQISDAYVLGLSHERDALLALHAEVVARHPEWVVGEDARTNLIAKPVNLILSAVANIRITQKVVVSPQWWSTEIAPSLNTEAAIGGPLFELQNFYRFGFFQFLMSNIEHGLRAIQPKVVHGEDSQADEAFWKVYTSLFNGVLSPERAANHINTFSFLGALRNTIHNNGVYYPTHHKDTTYVVGGKSYQLKDGQVVDVFGWAHFADYLNLIRSAITDVLRAPKVAEVPHISDIASFQSPAAPRAPGLPNEEL